MKEDSTSCTTVRLTYKNYEFEVNVDQETCNRINNDEEYKEDFARQTYESLENDGHFIEESNEDVKFPITPNFKWTKPAIDQLINIRFSRNDEFNNPSIRKSLLWQSVASTLANKYPGVTGEMCDAKYRNLLHTYKLNKQKQTKYGLESVKWEYFDQFDQSLGLQMSSMSQKDVVFFDSLLASDDCDEFNKQDLIILPSGSPDPGDISSRKRSASQEMSIGQYLRIKAENDIRNMKLKARIWKEKKQLKEREISAILQLAKALKNKK